MDWQNISNGDDGLNVRNKLNSTLRFLVHPTVTEVTNNYAIDSAIDKIILVTTGEDDIIVTLPDLSETVTYESNIFMIIKIDDGSGKVIINGYGSDKIMGQNYVTISYQWEIYKLLKYSILWIPIY